MPHLALPMLTASLRAGGVEVAQRDLNLEVFDAVLTQTYLEDVCARLASEPPPGLSPATVQEALDRAAGTGPNLIRQVEPAKAVMRDPRFYDGRTSVQAFVTLVQGLALASLPFHPAQFQFTSFTPPGPVDSSGSLLRLAGDPARNPFSDLFQRSIVGDILRDAPDVVGISIPTMDQMLAGVTLAYLLKQAGSPAHVTIGGPHVSMLREQLLKTPALFDFVDSAIVFGGEGPLLRLVESLGGDRDLSKVPNLIYRDRGVGSRQVRATPVASIEHQDRAAADCRTPDFDGLPLDRYLTPELVLPLLSSHGCYHGKCAFCNVGYGGPDGFRMIDPDLVVDQMRALRQKYGTRHIFFADEALTPRTLRTLSKRLADAGDDIAWCGCARFDPGLTRDLLDAMARGGCRMLLFGLETASEATIARMHKGTAPETMGRILRDSAAAGIWNHTFFFFGFPGETMEAAQDTVNFLYAHQGVVHSASPGAFLLERYAPAQRFPAEYGITRIREDHAGDLAIYFDYELTSGLDEAMADRLASRLVDVLPRKAFGQYYVTDVYRFLYASYLWDHSEPLPLWLV
ncbi:MAG: B12-binding domain-containing radical SAM protein [Anaerolineae bacterium]|jgi:hypothetical protein|nr:B12-binding domain-containing radical SAM protein [Anaerolineae bacterium]